MNGPTPTIHLGDSLEILRSLPDASIAAVVCDPPYGLSNVTPAKVTDTISRWLAGERDYTPPGQGFMGRCFHPDTEILTREGWVPVADVAEGELVCALNPDDRSIEYIPVVKAHTYDFDGDLLRVGGRSAVQLVTPNHHIWEADRGLVRADSLGAHFRLSNQGTWLGSGPSKVEIGTKTFDVGDLLYFLGLWLGDGYSVKRVAQPWKQDFLGFRAKKVRKLQAFHTAMARLNLRFTFNLSGEFGNFYLYDKDLQVWLAELGRARDKFVPGWVFDHSPAVLQRLYDGLMETDGSVQGKKSQHVFTTTSRRLADDFQRLCLHLGKSATLSTRETAPSEVAGRLIGPSRGYVLSVVEARSGFVLERSGRHAPGRTRQPAGVSTVAYSGPVHCVTLARHHVLMSRLEGKTVWSGNSWDAFVPPPALWDQVMRVLVPGGHVLAFAGARTQDLMALSLRLAGFEIRDSIAWLYGNGMPKGRDIGRAVTRLDPETTGWEGWSTTLKPAHEPITVARKPLTGTVEANNLTHGAGGLNIGATRVPFASEADEAETKTKNAHASFGSNARQNATFGDASMIAMVDYDAPGRWTPNVVLDPDQAGELDQQSGTTRSRIAQPRQSAAAGPGWRTTHTGAEYDDVGGASRFFHVIDHDPLDALPSRALWSPKATAKERPVIDGVRHQTVKPLALMRLLVRLVTPAGGIVLDPFAGSGTTVEAALLEGFDVIGIERHEPYRALIEFRIDRARSTQGPGQAAA